MAKAPKQNWIYRPSLDLLVGCGAWSLPLLLLAYPFRDSGVVVLSGAFYTLALLCNYPHYMATIYRAYHTREDFQQYRTFTIHITGLVLATMLLTHGMPRLLPWIFTLYLTWSPWHYMGQNFGLAMMFARRNGVQPARRDRNLLWAAFVISYAIVFLSIHSRPSNDSYVMSLALPVMAGRIARLILVPAFLVTATLAFRGMAGDNRKVAMRAFLPAIVLVTTEFLWFVLPSLLEIGWGFRIPQQRYADGVLAMMHSAQYLWITSYYARREAQAASKHWSAWAYFGVLVAGGIALFVPGPWFFSRAVGLDYTASFLTFTAMINIHHFILDGAIWKLRDKRISSLLVDAKGSVAESTKEAGGKFGDAIDWLTGRTPGARVFRRAAVAALLALALLDQVKYVFSLDGGSVSRLSVAAMLNPNDSSIWLSRAQAEAKDGHVSEALASLKRAVAVNPNRQDAQKALAVYYLQNHIYDKALEQYQQMGQYVTFDAGSWMNYGLLEWELKHTDTAVDYWQNAENLDPILNEVQLYLAGAFDDLGQNEDSIRHYERYIVLLSEGGRIDLQQRKSLALTSLKLAAAYHRTGQIDRARYYNEKAALLAQQVPDAVIESLARMRLGDTLAQLDRRSDALRNYQTALFLDARTKDDPTIGADWHNYAQFLSQIEAPRAYVLASYLMSEHMLGEKADPEPREKLEKEMGQEAKWVRGALTQTLKLAMNYKLPN